VFELRLAGILTSRGRANRLASAAASAGLSADEDATAAFGGLSAALRDALAPVNASASFRQHLERDLAALARQKKAPQVVLQRPRSHRRQILIGAAVSSAVSVAGLLAFLWHHRARQATQRAA